MTVPRKLWVVVVVLFACLPSLWVVCWDWNGASFASHYDDDMVYYVSAKSLAEKGSYRLLHLPGEPPSTKFPPLWPAWLSLAWRIEPRFPENLVVAKWLSWLLVPFYLGGICWWFLNLALRRWETAMLLVFVGSAPLFLHLAGSFMSEILFGLLLFAVVALSRDPSCEKRALAAGFTSGLCFLTRTAGLALLPGVAAWYWWLGQRRQAAAFLAGMAPAILGWTLWSSNHRPADLDVSLAYYFGYNDSLQTVGTLAERVQMVGQNAAALPLQVGRNLIFYAGSEVLPTYLVHLVGLVALVGAAQLGFTAYTGFAVCLLAMLSCWTYPPMERLVFPLLPLAAVGFYRSLKKGCEVFLTAVRKAEFLAKAIGASGLLAIAGVLVFALHSQIELLSSYPELMQQAQIWRKKKEEVYQWIQGQPAAFWIATTDGELYLYTGQKAVSFHPPTTGFYRGDLQAAREWVASLPFPRGMPPPTRLFWTPGGFELDPEDMRWVRKRLDEKLAPPLLDCGEIVVFGLDRVRGSAARDVR